MIQVQVNLNKEREPLSHSNIKEYNEVVDYLATKESRRQYHHNHQRYKETASVIKFTLEKEVRKQEVEVLDRLLFSAFISGVNNVIVRDHNFIPVPKSSSNELIYDDTSLEEVYGTLLPHLVQDYQGQRIKNVYQDWKRSNTYKSLYAYTRILPIDTDFKGLYCFQSVKNDVVTFIGYTKRNEIYKALFDRGFVTDVSSVPQPLKISVSYDVREAMLAVDAAKTMSRGSIYRKAIVSKLKQFVRNYRWQSDECLRDEIKKLI